MRLEEPCKLQESVIGEAPRSCHVLFGTEAATLALPLNISWLESLSRPVLPSKEAHIIRMERSGRAGGSSGPLQPLSPSLETLLHAVRKGDPGGQMAGPGALGRTRFFPGHPVCVLWAPCLTTLLVPFFCFAWLHDLDALGSSHKP